ncbi:hypothetical protein [Amorphus coralli]|uniref:hypothetical protein n=1 Tax=Amorphus coralli TaxID=340680 RepID=UPI00037CA599|nr:hypothetical protein [Amorphus coralli]
MAVHLSGSDRSTRAAAAFGFAVALIVAAVGALMLTTGDRLDRSGLRFASDEVVGTIGHSIGGLVSRAVELGIPLADLYGVDGYLQGVIAANPEVDGIAITDADGKALFQQTRRAGVAFDATVTVPIRRGDTVVGQIAIDPSYGVATMVRLRLVAAALAASLFAGLLAGLWYRIYRLELIDLPRARFVASSRAVGRGGFADYTPPPEDSPLRPLGRAAVRLIVPVRRQARNAAALADEIRAIDVTKTFSGRVDAALQPLAAYRFDHLRQPVRRHGWGGWMALPVFALVEAARPLVAGFAADRIGTDPLTEVAIGLALSGDALGRLIGVLAAYAIALWLPRAGVVLGLLVAAAGTAATFTIHETLPFAAARIAVGFGLWLSAWSLLARTGGLARRPWQGALLLVALWGIGPILGGLVAEILGRRTGFLALGGAIAALSAVCLLQPYRPTSRTVFAWRPAAASDILAPLIAVLAVTAWLEVHLSGHVMRDNYAGMALQFGLAATAMTLPWLVPTRLPATAGAALAVAAVWLAVLTPAPAFLVSPIAGLGLGLVWAALASRTYSLPAATGMTLGLLGAGALGGASFWTGADPLTLTAGIATAALAALAANALISKRLPRSAPGHTATGEGS